MNQFANTVFLLTSNGMGNAPKELCHKLLRTYLTLLLQNDELPAAICFYTEGVRLATEGSHVLDLLKQLETKGVRLILCSTCLNYFKLADEVCVGVVGGMGDIQEAHLRADKVITL